MNKLSNYFAKCDNKNQYRAILETAMISNLEGFTGNGPMLLSQYVNVKILV